MPTDLRDRVLHVVRFGVHFRQGRVYAGAHTQKATDDEVLRWKRLERDEVDDGAKRNSRITRRRTSTCLRHV